MPITDPPPFNLRRAFYFVALADELHFGHAADRLDIAQPGLSRQIKALEAELGVQLVERGRRETRLTPAGELFHDEAARLLAQAGDVAERVRAQASRRTPGLSIGYSRSATFGETTQLVQDFRALHPDIPVRTTTAWTALNLEMLRTRKVDVVLIRAPVEGPDLETLTLITEEHVVALPPGHDLAGRGRLELTDVADENMVLWPRKNGPSHYDRLVRQIWGSGRPRLVLEESEDEQIMEAVCAGIGLAVFETRRALHLARDGVTIRRFADPAPTCELAVVWRRDDHAPNREAFVAFCRQHRPFPAVTEGAA